MNFKLAKTSELQAYKYDSGEINGCSAVTHAHKQNKNKRTRIEFETKHTHSHTHTRWFSSNNGKETNSGKNSEGDIAVNQKKKIKNKKKLNVNVIYMRIESIIGHLSIVLFLSICCYKWNTHKYRMMMMIN